MVIMCKRKRKEVLILLKDSAAVVTGRICCCGVIYIPLHPCFSPPPALSLLLSICLPHEYWAAHQIFIAHAHNTRCPPPYAVHTRALTNELRTPTLPLRAWTRPYTLTCATVQLFKRYKGKEAVQTERPWKFNTPSVRRSLQTDTHWGTGVCSRDATLLLLLT